jgi:hypothetical protein
MVQWLPVKEFWYNTNFYSVLARSPFEVLYVGLQSGSAVSVTDLKTWLQDWEVVSRLVQQRKGL